MSKTRVSFLLGLSGLLLIGCDSASKEEASAPARAAEAKADAPAPISAADRGSEEFHAKAGEAPPPPAARPELAPLGDARSDDGEGDRGAERFARAPLPTPGQLTAGRWSDRDDWTRWQLLLSPGSSYASMLDSWFQGHLQRVAVTLRDADGAAADTTLVLEDDHGNRLWQARTDNHGRAELYLQPGQSGRLSVRTPDGRTLATRRVHAGEQHELRVGEDVPVAAALDLMFVVDTTGSMGDELHYLQTELTDIVGRVRRDSAQALQVRTSVNFFRDEGDDYVVRSYPFTSELSETMQQLRAEHASGGGDYPEALDAALSDAVEQHQWSESAVARIVFVVTDAPPHDGFAVGQRLQRVAAAAAGKGIRIVPIASSGIDKPTEFVLRHLAVSTGGTYVFLTDHSGIGNAHIEPTVGPHTVQPLGDLIVDIIDEHTRTDGLRLTVPAPIAAWTPEQEHEHPCGYAMGRTHDRDFGGWGMLGAGLLLPALLGGLWWHRSRRAPLPVADARVARARRMLDALLRARAGRGSETSSWAIEIREVVEGMEQLARQQQAIDTSLRVAGAQPGEADPTGMRTALRAEVARRRAEIDAELEAGLVSVEAAYLHVLGGVGERSATQASLDAAREALQTRIELERELRVDG
ncbi:vWA domain-containing protein [Paraliomyxa miuraensis]|uniref:vWA domain-containing protein n=1 Tax=Paraliomyxa miuraensis TaxID=376150 RepID=UPI002256F5C8|nr:vWA domain-containing protein [Paraliomyxa miuraensis]MCX4241362.1 VWA domain-containing protein [Paraliomyxa miuraensis]